MRGTMMDYPLTLHHVFERATTLFPEQEIVTAVGGGRRRSTYRQFGERVRRLASALSAAGVRPGDRVASFAWGHDRHLELYFAVPLLGAVLHTVNIRLFPDDIRYIIDHAGDRLLFADRSLLPHVRQLLPSLPTVEQVVSMDDDSDIALEDALDYEALLATGDECEAFTRPDEDEAAMLCYTSGTTGRPKGVAYSHRALVLHAFGACTADSFAISQRDSVMAIVPMYHACAWGLPYASTLAGAKQVYAGVAPRPETLLALLAEEGVTCAAGVPTVWLGLLPAIASGKYDLSRLARIPVGGSAVPPSLLEAFDRLGLPILHAWGMTEMTPLGAIGSLKRHIETRGEDERRAYRVKQGLPVAGVDARAVDAAGQDVPHDGATMGDLLVRGPWVAASYYRQPETTDAWTADGWFRTGDVATIDADGYIQLVDRTKDLIKSGGEWISSVALENTLMAHPKVLEAAVVAVPDPRWQERPLACVVPKPDAVGLLDAAELVEHLRPRFPKWQLPDHYVFLEELPKTSVGKFDKKALRSRYQSTVLA